MPKYLKYATPVSIHLDPIKGQTVRCTRINVFPANGTATYEFQAFDAQGKPVGGIFHTTGYTGKDADALLAMAYASVQERLGKGDVAEEAVEERSNGVRA